MKQTWFFCFWVDQQMKTLEMMMKTQSCNGLTTVVFTTHRWRWTNWQHVSQYWIFITHLYMTSDDLKHMVFAVFHLVHNMSRVVFSFKVNIQSQKSCLQNQEKTNVNGNNVSQVTLHWNMSFQFVRSTQRIAATPLVDWCTVLYCLPACLTDWLQWSYSCPWKWFWDCLMNVSKWVFSPYFQAILLFKMYSFVI